MERDDLTEAQTAAVVALKAAERAVREGDWETAGVFTKIAMRLITDALEARS